jgi:hypothetical protein
VFLIRFASALCAPVTREVLLLRGSSKRLAVIEAGILNCCQLSVISRGDHVSLWHCLVVAFAINLA